MPCRWHFLRSVLNSHVKELSNYRLNHSYGMCFMCFGFSCKSLQLPSGVQCSHFIGEETEEAGGTAGYESECRCSAPCGGHPVNKPTVVHSRTF